MKPCLVNKTSTSDEELQLNESNQIPSNTGRANEQPTHGILKVPSGKKFWSFIKSHLFLSRFNKSGITITTSTANKTSKTRE